MGDEPADVGVRQLAKEAAIWALPYVLFGRYLALAEQAHMPANRFMLDGELSTPKTKAMGPNVDTLYGHAWIDLSDGPVVLRTPEASERYFSVQLVDAFQTMIGYVGNHTTGSEARDHVLVGPGWRGSIPDGMRRIDSPTDRMLGLVRTHARGPSDVAAAQAVHTGYQLGPLAEHPDGLVDPIVEVDAASRFPYFDLAQAGAAYFDEIGALLPKMPPPATDHERLQRFAQVGIGPGEQPSRDPVRAPLLEEAVREGVGEVVDAAARARTHVDEWWYVEDQWRRVPEDDPLVRAAVNFQGPGFHIAEEAIYVSATTDHDGSPLDGTNTYRMRFPAGGQPPVHEFWSMTMYAEPEMALVDNPIDRYAIGSDTPGLVLKDDGALELVLQDHEPSDAGVNWLPAPAGPFMLLVRLYRPGREVLDRRYQLPRIVRA